MTTTCHYCRARNEADDHRCQRCGRRLGESGSFPVSTSALAPDLRSQPQPAAKSTPAFGPQIVPPPARAGVRSDVAYQASLFGPQEVSRAVEEPSARKPVPNPAPRVRRDRTAQQSLDFTSQTSGARTLKNSVDAAIYCNARAALTAHRVMAAVIDSSIGVIALAVFFLSARLTGYEMDWSKQTLPLYIGIALVLTLFYKALYCVANGDTPGVRWTGLRLLNFDGHMPTRRQRFHRLAGGCISVIAAGLGLLWALCDEEHLTWHDHMSKTFPASY